MKSGEIKTHSTGEAAIVVNQGKFHLSGGSISENTGIKSFKTSPSSGAAILQISENAVITKDNYAYLKNGEVIEVAGSLLDTCNVNIECETIADNTIVAKASSEHTLTDSDCSKIKLKIIPARAVHREGNNGRISKLNATEATTIIENAPSGVVTTVELSGNITTGEIQALNQALINNPSAKIALDMEDVKLEFFPDTSMADTKSLVSITTPKTLKRTGYRDIFKENSNLETVILNEGLEIIDRAAFWRCPNLKNITIPSTVKEIHTMAFTEDGCSEFIFTGTSLPTKVDEAGIGVGGTITTKIKCPNIPRPADCTDNTTYNPPGWTNWSDGNVVFEWKP